MSFFRRGKRRKQKNLNKEAELTAVKNDILLLIHDADKRSERAITLMDEAIDALDEKDLGVSGMLFLATGGDKRLHHDK